ncbi:MAG: hypothetical protein AB7L66_14245 [Gemmatimonadales bacterium]
MKPFHALTIAPNRYRARELRAFRELVELYFDRSQRDPDDVVYDYEGTRDARSRINRMLPRVLQVVRAAGIGGPVRAGGVTDPGIPLARIEVLERIFSGPYGAAVEQEIFDVVDMALGVYDGSRIMALGRTINPLHYLGMALGIVARGPRWFVSSLGFGGRSRQPVRSTDVARLEAIAGQLADAEELIESRFLALQDRQAARQAETARQLAELAERLDFAERVLARRPKGQLGPPEQAEISTPV